MGEPRGHNTVTAWWLCLVCSNPINTKTTLKADILHLDLGSLVLVLHCGCPWVRSRALGDAVGVWLMGLWLLQDKLSWLLPSAHPCLTALLSPRMPLLEGRFLLGARKTATRCWKGSHHPRRGTTGSTASPSSPRIGNSSLPARRRTTSWSGSPPFRKS